MKLKNGDFILLDYTGKIKDSKQVFDTTSEQTAKDSGVHQKGAKYKPAMVCVGEGDVLKGLDEDLVGKEVGKSYIVEISPEKGFGKKDAKLMKIVNTNMFLKNNINPVPGLQVNVDNLIGTIKTVSGGRTIIDFNHPLAGKNLVYEFNVLKIVVDDEEKIKGMLSSYLAIDNPEVKIEAGVAKVDSEVPEMLQKQLEEKIKNLIPAIKKVDYKKKEEKKEEKPKEEKKEQKS
ncbi:MAG: peptidylprolyl isomerase [Nanoarchaeota archaeon]|nr:peptidylprolyl isomerase [Nanoarchaeota archaeon]